MVEFEVNFDDSCRVYLPGTMMTGEVILRIQERLKLCQLVATFSGVSFCKWASGGEHQRTYVNEQKCLNQRIVLMGSSDVERVLDAGDYSYRFGLQLPRNIPPTFVFVAYPGKATIEYAIELAAETKKKKNCKRAKFNFRVASSPVDASRYPYLLEPITNVQQELSCCLCCVSGLHVLHLRLDKQVFHLGEPIAFHAELDNSASGKKLGQVKAKLCQIVILTSDSGVREMFIGTAASVLLAQTVNSGSQNTWDGEIITNASKVPLEPTFDNCACVSVSYKLVVEAKVPCGYNTKPEVGLILLPRMVMSQPQSLQSMVPVIASQPQVPLRCMLFKESVNLNTNQKTTYHSSCCVSTYSASCRCPNCCLVCDC